ncbi:MAG: 1-(5-phosphoribosyl)-5-[(5-phosphoribosylamino)methylideneamino]imidazole-4-carboxamide isomerase [Bacteroides sp.]|nr:1-(5-phosphoribosyl)-5-[(5-phosphoribosylamino)methylideneamino]imidazole-4-carboxamide isomerase [Bacteroides sp.]
MSKIEIIPAIDIIEGRTVRLRQGDFDCKKVYDESPYDAARRYVDAGFSRIHVVDLDGAKSSSPVNISVLEKLSGIEGIKVEWGGGIKDDDALNAVFAAGAAYAVIGSVAAKRPEMFAYWLRLYGGERMVLGADVMDGIVRTNGWLAGAGISLGDMLRQFIPYGLKRVICTDISHDGMLQGPSFDLYGSLHGKFPQLEFTVSGGISSMSDIEKLEDMDLESVIVGKALYEGFITLDQLSKFNRQSN